MASLTQWAWVWVNSESWWWTGRPGVLWFMGSQRVGYDWATELNWTGCLRYLWQQKKQMILIYVFSPRVYKWTTSKSCFNQLQDLPRNAETILVSHSHRLKCSGPLVLQLRCPSQHSLLSCFHLIPDHGWIEQKNKVSQEKGVLYSTKLFHSKQEKANSNWPKKILGLYK